MPPLLGVARKQCMPREGVSMAMAERLALIMLITFCVGFVLGRVSK